MYSPLPSSLPPPSGNYSFLASPPKHKHKPQPLAVRCVPPRTLSRPASTRRRSSISGSPAFQTSFVALVDSPTPDTPKTPHLTTHGYTAAFATLYPRRGSLPDVHHAQPRPARRVPSSPKGSPKRRQHRTPTPFAPPSPTRPHGRPRAGSTTRIPAPRTPPPPTPTPKLSKIRSLTNLRARSPSPAPPAMSAPTPKPTSKRAKRSATPARGSAAYAKYRPMPFIQQMQMIQFLEGGSLDSHIRRHHVHAGQGTAHTGFATAGEGDIAHGYAFTDEQGMVWFDEEEEWEFACLLPRTRPQPRKGIKRLLGKRREEESEDEWEEFAEESEREEEELNADALLAREDDDLHAGDEDLAAFGGTLQGAWARARPAQSVLNLPEPKHERRNKRKRARHAAPPAPVPAPAHPPTTALKHEFLSTAFAPPPARASSSASSPPSSRATSPFRMFTRAPTPSLEDKPSTAGSGRTFFQRQHRHARSVPTAAPDTSSGQSFASLGASMRGGAVLDGPAALEAPPSPAILWADTGSRAPSPARSSSSASTMDPQLRSVSPPLKAARRLGIEPATAVSLRPVPVKKGFMGVRGLKSVRRE